MKRSFFPKTLALILCCALLIFSFAWLPGLALRWQEQALQPTYTPSDQISLEMESEPDPASVMRSLELLCQNPYHREIPTAVASREQKDIQSIFYDTLDTYIQAGLVHMPSGDSTLRTQTFIIFDSIWAISVIFWQVKLICGNWYFELVIDDGNGAVCSLTCEDLVTPVSVGTDTLLTFGRLYLDSLGEPFSQWEVSDISFSPSSADALMVSGGVNWGDLHYGECWINFFVTGDTLSIQPDSYRQSDPK